jgi:hypothetical protein
MQQRFEIAMMQYGAFNALHDALAFELARTPVSAHSQPSEAETRIVVQPPFATPASLTAVQPDQSAAEALHSSPLDMSSVIGTKIAGPQNRFLPHVGDCPRKVIVIRSADLLSRIKPITSEPHRSG